MSTLHEIAMNHAKMALEKAAELAKSNPLSLQIVSSLELPSTDARQEVALHFIASVADAHHGYTANYGI
ncbi:hypothetical protein ACQKP5_14795 [Pseudomonas vancouverensis]|uniref:hypothetical protein n=1 Tax=Pseudomonas vancouverensis TaxID=95300 RepID=UPI003CFD2E4C